MSQLKQNNINSVGDTSSSKTDLSLKPSLVTYTKDEDSVWKYLYKKQVINLKNKAIPKFFDCLNKYNLPKEYIPQISEISNRLREQTGWEIVRVEELIDNKSFFKLLANRKFPSTVYIRQRSEIDISKDPDIFHEMFGHVTMLLDSKHAHYMWIYGQIALELNEIELGLLQRLFWFTYEVGLIQTSQGIKIYGGSILSSFKESEYVSKTSNIKPFSLLDVFRTPYRADQLQQTYYVLDNFQTLSNILDDKQLLINGIWQAYNLGEFPAQFPIDDSHYVSFNLCKPIVSPENSTSNMLAQVNLLDEQMQNLDYI